jgi:hypothetical protein
LRRQLLFDRTRHVFRPRLIDSPDPRSGRIVSRIAPPVASEGRSLARDHNWRKSSRKIAEKQGFPASNSCVSGALP